MKETIVAQATAPGRGGIGILRVSGPKALEVAQAVLGKCPKPRMADYLPFKDADGTVLDQGIALYFKSPNSFTGEDVLELQGHGGQVVLDLLLKRILQLDGVRLARPGEFSEQAFLNDKLDLAQAEAIADLIDATSEQAARSALKSLQGEFSNKVNQLVDSVIYLRTYVEASIDFPDEEIDFLADGKIEAKLREIINQLDLVRSEAKQGSILREGMKVVIAGRPNAGKSSLLNALAGREAAIVTDIAGTTRDILEEYITLHGISLKIIDTAGIRETKDIVEKIGVDRAREMAQKADLILYVVDSSVPLDENDEEIMEMLTGKKAIILYNKTDLQPEIQPEILKEKTGHPVIPISAKEEKGITELEEQIKDMFFGGEISFNDEVYITNARHKAALEEADRSLDLVRNSIERGMPEDFFSIDLMNAYENLGKILGESVGEDLVNEIFSKFCMGK